MWNKIARDNTDKKNVGGAAKPKGADDKKTNDKKKLDKPFPGPGTYEIKSGFPEVEKKDQKKEKKDKDDKEKGKKEDPKIFGAKIANVPGPGN